MRNQLVQMFPYLLYPAVPRMYTFLNYCTKSLITAAPAVIKDFYDAFRVFGAVNKLYPATFASI